MAVKVFLVNAFAYARTGAEANIKHKKNLHIQSKICTDLLRVALECVFQDLSV